MSRPSPEVAAEIVRLHYAEHWKVGTIAQQLGLHRDVVERLLGVGAGVSHHPPSRKRPKHLKQELVIPTGLKAAVHDAALGPLDRLQEV